MAYPYNAMLFSCKRNEILNYTIVWINEPQNIMLSERNQTQSPHVRFHLHDMFRISKFIKKSIKEISGCQELEGGGMESDC